MQESAGYPSSSTKLSDEVQNQLLNLPDENGVKLMDINWFQENIWKETVAFEIPQDQVICGMQANIYKIILSNDKGEILKLVAKRVVPKELPSKANLKIWQDFLNSVDREVNFYNHISKLNPDLFPNIYYSSGMYRVFDKNVLYFEVHIITQQSAHFFK